MTLNAAAVRIADELEQQAERYRVAVSRVAGVRVIDCGGAVPGSLAAGIMMARACVGDQAEVSLVPYPHPAVGGLAVQVSTDVPVLACLAAQYAGWKLQVGSYFAMVSGPIRAAAAREELFRHIPGQEQAVHVVGVLETAQHPTEEAIAALVAKLPRSTEHVTLLVAPTTSLAGTVQIVARSVETALHKLHELKFDVQQVTAGWGIAPLPPPAPETVAAIGRTNDAILYGGEVVLWVRCDDETITAIGPQVPANASRDYGVPFAELFARYHGDFYKIDPLLFAPAVVEFRNLKSGRCFRYGQIAPELLRRSAGRD